MCTTDPSALTENVPQVTNQQTPIVLDTVNCRGTEQQLAQCGHANSVNYCNHMDDAGAYCTNIIGTAKELMRPVLAICVHCIRRVQ